MDQLFAGKSVLVTDLDGKQPISYRHTMGARPRFFGQEVGQAER